MRRENETLKIDFFISDFPSEMAANLKQLRYHRYESQTILENLSRKISESQLAFLMTIDMEALPGMSSFRFS